MQRSYKLTKPRVNDTLSPCLKPVASPDVPGFDDDDGHGYPFRASYDQIRLPDARQRLKERLTSRLPETPRKTSHDSARSASMQLKGFSRGGSSLDVGANASAKSSSSTVDSAGMTSNAVDIESAINLLQELKKTASPTELVALHRALLPTKEVQTVSRPKQSSFAERSTLPPPPAWQRRAAAVHPGLATRGGLAEDPLRRQDEAVQGSRQARAEKRDGWFPEDTSAATSSLAALDLADETANPLAARAATPSDFDIPQTGWYEHGTLRITNGCASPTPSFRTAVGEEQDDLPLPTLQALMSSDESLSHGSGRASIDVLPGRAIQLPALSRHPMPAPIQLPQRRAEPPQQKAGLTVASKELPVHATSPRTRDFRRNLSFDVEASVSPISVMGTPRLNRSLTADRASQISAEYASECDILGSPYEDKNPLLEFAKRLSTVYDSDGDDDEGLGSPAEALSKLNGIPESDPGLASFDFTSVPSTEEQSPWQQHENSIRAPPHKVDSGYASDVSFRRQRASRGAGTTNSSKANDDSLNEVDERSKTDSVTDIQSLYTFEQILQSPGLLHAATAPSPQEMIKPKKSSPLFRLQRLKSGKRSSMPTMPTSSAQDSPDTIATIATAQSSPASVKKSKSVAKQQKKLQKPMPESVKTERREENRKVKEVTSMDVPLVPEALASTHALRVGSLAGTTSQPTTPAASAADLTMDLAPAQPAELSADAEITRVASDVEDKRTFFRRRSKSRGRGRSNTVREGNKDDKSGETWRPLSMQKRRKSESRSRSQSAKRSSMEIVTGSCMAGGTEDRPVSADDDNVPAFTDFGSVARSLGGGSYDISTNLFRRATAPVPSAVQHQIQSPYMISTGLFKPKTTKGMTPEKATEFARMKSRDFAHASTPAWYERPRMATPKGKSKTGSQDDGCQRKVEDFIPEWQSKPVSSNPAPKPRMMHRPHSMYAESIPPMPELPADVEIKAHRADEIVAKKFRDSARSTPATSARNSAEVQEAKSESAKKRSRSKPRREESSGPDQAHQLQLPSPRQRAAVKQTEDVAIRVRELNGSSSEESIAVIEQPQVQETPVHSLSHEPQQEELSGWEQQAKLWRRRRQSLGVALQRPVADHDDDYVQSPMSTQTLESPSIVVSRYITPLGEENAIARANAGYRQLHSAPLQLSPRPIDDKENRPAKADVPRTDSANSISSSGTFVTVKSWDPRPAKQDIPRMDSATSTTTTTTTHSRRFTAYTTSKADLVESLRAYQNASFSTTSLDCADGSVNSSTTSLATPESYDRYSGGLGYGWDRSSGFSGSAGTRTSGGKRKSVRMSEDYGLDLSDVPVFLQRAG